MADKTRDLGIVGRVMADAHRYPCVIPIVHAWHLSAGIDVARRHPSLHPPMKSELRQIVKRIEKAIAERHPEVKNAFAAQDIDVARWTELVTPAMSDPEPITVTLTVRETWLLISALQLSIRHPELKNREGLIALARLFQKQIDDTHPEASELLERGWHSEYDTN